MEYSNYEYFFFLSNLIFIPRKYFFASRKIKASEFMEACKQKRRERARWSKVNVDAEKGETRGRGKKE